MSLEEYNMNENYHIRLVVFARSSAPLSCMQFIRNIVQWYKCFAKQVHLRCANIAAQDWRTSAESMYSDTGNWLFCEIKIYLSCWIQSDWIGRMQNQTLLFNKYMRSWWKGADHAKLKVKRVKTVSPWEKCTFGSWKSITMLSLMNLRVWYIATSVPMICFSKKKKTINCCQISAPDCTECIRIAGLFNMFVFNFDEVMPSVLFADPLAKCDLPKANVTVRVN